MRYKINAVTFLLAAVMAIAGFTVLAQQTQPAPPVQNPAIPGITADDPLPNGCVNCHRYKADTKRDGRLSTLLDKWSVEGTEADFLNIAKSVWPRAKLTGKHPAVADMLKGENIPSACIQCHNAEKLPLNREVHLIHLSILPEFTGQSSSFLAKYGGYCTNCHTLGLTTGRVAIKFGKENTP